MHTRRVQQRAADDSQLAGWHLLAAVALFKPHKKCNASQSPHMMVAAIELPFEFKGEALHTAVGHIALAGIQANLPRANGQHGFGSWSVTGQMWDRGMQEGARSNLAFHCVGAPGCPLARCSKGWAAQR